MKKTNFSAKGWIAPVMVCLSLLLFTYGAVSVQSVQEYGGRILSGLLVDLAGSNALVAHLLAGTALFAAFLGLVILATKRDGKRPTYLAAVLALTVPAAVYSQSYGSLNGALTVAPAAALVLFYMVLVEKLLDAPKKKAIFALPLFLMGLAAPLFHEVLGLGLVLLSLRMTVKYWKRGSWVLLLHTLAACAGSVVALLLSKLPLFTDLLYRTEAVVDGVLAGNWPLLVLLTTACLLLVQPLRSEHSKRCTRILRGLLWPVAVFALCPYLETVAPLAAALKIVFATMYALGVWNTIHVYVHREARRHRLYRLLWAVGALSLPMCLVGEQNDGLLLVPCLVLTAVTLLLWGYALSHFDKLERFWRKLVPVVCALTLFCFGWISVFNGITQDARTEHILSQESAGVTEIRLPEYPFAAYRGEEAEPAGFTVESCPWEEWDWDSYVTKLSSADSGETEGEEYQNPLDSTTETED